MSCGQTQPVVLRRDVRFRHVHCSATKQAVNSSSAARALCGIVIAPYVATFLVNIFHLPRSYSYLDNLEKSSPIHTCHPGVCDDVNLKTLVQTEEELLPSGHQAPKHKPSLTKAKVEEGLSTAETIAITTDGWTSRATDSYMTITAHYITGNWQIANHVLQTRPVYLWFAAQAVLSYLSVKQ